MGVKISSLPINTLPYSGGEKIPLVQGSETRAGTLSSFVNYLSGALLSDSELRALSGNWQNTYTTFRSNSANYAVKNADNSFSTNQTFTQGVVIGTVTDLKQLDSVGLAGDGKSIAMGVDAGTNAGSTILDFGYNIFIGDNNGNNTGSSDGTATYITSLGTSAGQNIGFGNGGYANNVIVIGTEAGFEVGNAIVGLVGSASNIIAIGSNAGRFIGASSNIGSGSGSATNIIAIGGSAGISAGQGGQDGGGQLSNAIFIGQEAGYEANFNNSGVAGALSSTEIIAIGTQAGYQTGYVYPSNNNIFIGLSSGYTKQGSRNTFIGDLTNTSPTFSENLSGCIAIGYGATPTARNTIAIGSDSTPLSVVPGGSLSSSLSGLKIMINGRYFTIPLLA